MRLRNQRIWIIGASSGIGAELAARLAKRGSRLALSARRREQLEAVASGIRPGEAHVVPLDVTEREEVTRACEEVQAALGGIDIVIYCAGTWTRTKVTEFDLDAAELQIATNLTGLVRAVHAVLPVMFAQGSGEIVAISSLTAYRALPGAEIYGATKAAMITFLEALRIDLEPHHIGVTTVNPGFVSTPLTDDNDFAMPFIVSLEEAGQTIIDGLRRDRVEISFPRRAEAMMKIMNVLPRPLFNLVARRLRRVEHA